MNKVKKYILNNIGHLAVILSVLVIKETIRKINEKKKDA